jgi:hypothetical protein
MQILRRLQRWLTGRGPLRSGGKDTVEGSYAIRLPEWRRTGLLDPGLTSFAYGPFRCTRRGDTVEIEWYNREGGRCADTVRLAARRLWAANVVRLSWCL